METEQARRNVGTAREVCEEVWESGESEKCVDYWKAMVDSEEVCEEAREEV